MARRSLAVNGMQINGDQPPPSTIAAQIVQHQTRPAATQQDAQAIFAGLINEILHNHDATPETDVDVNVKLVNVVAEAGLAPLVDDNPFAQWDTLIPQALDSIRVIEATFRRQPEILFTQTSEDGPQLLLPLLARLIGVCGRKQCESLPVAALLDSVLDVLTSSLDLWPTASTIQQIIRDCVEDVVSTLEAAKKPALELPIKLPPARSVARLWSQSEQAVALPNGCQTSVSDTCHAFELAVELSSMKSMPLPWQGDVQTRLSALLHGVRSTLEAAKTWNRVVEKMLTSSVSIALLTCLIGSHDEASLLFATQQHLAKALIRFLQQKEPAVRHHILPLLLSLAADEGFDTLHEDLKIAIATIVCRCCPQGTRPGRVEALSEALQKEDVMTDSELQPLFQQLSVAQSSPKQCCRRRKRRRIVPDSPADRAKTLTAYLARLLSSEEAGSLADVAHSGPANYGSLTEDDRCSVWQALLELTSFDAPAVSRIALRLAAAPKFQDGKQSRILAMPTVRACVESTTEAAQVNISESAFGRLCLQALHSHLRELRVAGARCLGAFLRDDLPRQVKQHNRTTTLEYLRVLNNRDVASEQETLVGAWGQVANVCEDSELNLALLRLVDYLGHSNPLICGLAFTELQRIGIHREKSAEDLLRPFWSSIAVSVVQDLLSRPQKAQQLCDLLDVSVNRFLVLTQLETVPSLVVARRSDVLQRIAAARENGTDVQGLIYSKPYTILAATLGLLLVQPAVNREEAALACLVEVAPGFQDFDIPFLVKTDAPFIGCHMLKNLAADDDKQNVHGSHSFQIFANIAQRLQGQARPGSKSLRYVAEYFDSHRLGILTHFSDTLENGAGTLPASEKICCLKAIGILINMDSNISSALPQIRAALQSAMEQPKLCEAAFDSWLKLLAKLESEDIGYILAQSFALILRHWSNLTEDMHQEIHGAVSHLVTNHDRAVKDHILTLPSLKGITLLSKIGAQIDHIKSGESVEAHCKAYRQRLQDESLTVVLRALEELVPYMEKNQEQIHEMANSEQRASVLSDLLRALLDATAKYSTTSEEASESCGKALGIIGCLDPNRLEATRKQRQVILQSNFEKASEVVDWAIVLLEDVLVKAFKAVTNARAQGYLAYTIQELLRFCGFNNATVLRPRSSQVPVIQQKWMDMPEHVRITLTPFVNSKYVVRSNTIISPPDRKYPDFDADTQHSAWLRALAYDLMWRGKGDNAQMVFPLLARIVRAHDIAIATFVLPYAILNVVLGGTVAEVQGITDEFLAVLSCEPNTSAQQETVRICSESVFDALDYMSNWLQQKRKALTETRATAYRTGHSPDDFNEATDIGLIDSVERFLASIPAEVIASQAVVCGSYSRALFHWEQFIRQKRPLIPSGRTIARGSDDEDLYEKLQDIYAQIDEPDGFEGISAHLPILNETQQAIQHVKGGRWTAAQAWYELQLADKPDDIGVQEKLLGCLHETGKYAPLLRYADSFLHTHINSVDETEARGKIIPSIVEAHWASGDLTGLLQRLSTMSQIPQDDFNVGIANVLGALQVQDFDSAASLVVNIRNSVTQTMNTATTASVHSSHDQLRKLHVLHEIDAIRALSPTTSPMERPRLDEMQALLDKRLTVVGSYVLDKRYILGVRRAAMQARPQVFENLDISSAWLATARIARQTGNTENAYNEVLKAHDCGAKGAKLEEARLLWRDGHQRHAIHALETAIKSNVFEAVDASASVDDTGRSSEPNHKQNMHSAKAHLLLAKWLDASGQSQSSDITDKYQRAAKYFQKWEKGHYYLGKHYQKLLEAEKAQPISKQDTKLLGGEYVKLVVENYLRSTPFGNKYWHQTIPKILTLWLDLGMTTIHRDGKDKHDTQTNFERRRQHLSSCNKQLSKYFERIPPYVIYSSMPQMLSRIAHPNPEVWKLLNTFLTRIVAHYPNQALWSLLAVVKATDAVRVERGTQILARLKREPNNKTKDAGQSSTDLRVMIQQGQRLSDNLLHACEAQVKDRAAHVSLAGNLGFNHKLAPNPLVVPMETTLTASTPNGGTLDSIRKHKAFAQDKITIQSFSDDVLVLTSLQRPRKLTVRGSDGKQYGLLCKPKDDLRKDQRLMEFNTVINRALKKDAESSKRRLYIKTYAVTPLSEESGTIEWVEGIKPIRDILLSLYTRRGIRPQYQDLKKILEDASVDPSQSHIFVEKVLPAYPPVLHEWFTETYAEPDAWFAARLRYARTAAVMSMTGHILGLGDRHGENILLEEGSGGVFHVDFNCLFDKGLTFEKPELVPFRLTHNMVDAMGPYGHEGPFRKSSELTLRLLRQSKDTLMTVLETFLYDPTTDFVGKKKRTTPGVPETPQEILESVERKLKGLLRGEAVPLSVEGHVDALVREATSPFCLASMYIGWCAFL